MAVGELIMNIRNVSSSLIDLIYDVKKCSCTYWIRLGSGHAQGERQWSSRLDPQAASKPPEREFLEPCMGIRT